MSWERDLARAASAMSAEAARQTRATTRGNVVEVLGDNRAKVQLPNGAIVTVRPGPNVEFSTEQSVTLLRVGNEFESMGASPWQGGKGSPFDAP